jgi:hypothetical protein
MIKKAIRKYCLWCSNNQPKEINQCSSPNCAFYYIRAGKNPNGIKRLKAITLRCIDCKAGSQKEVRECDNEKCPLYPYRKGKNPLRKGIGNKDIQKYSNFRKKLLSNTKNTKE